MSVLVCKKCKKSKRTSDFYLRKFKDGRSVPRKECKECRAEHNKNYLATLSQEQRQHRNKLMSIRQRRFAVEHPFYWIMKQVRWRAKRAIPRREVTIDTTYLEELWKIQGGLCALTKQPMVLSVLDKRGWRNQKDRISVDRIDPNMGYTRENTQLVRAMVNICKNAYAQPDFIKICCQVAAHSVFEKPAPSAVVIA